MVKVARPQQSYDAELAEKGQRRCYRTEFTNDCRPIYREYIMETAQFAAEKIPWWKKPTAKKLRPKTPKTVK